MVLPWKVASEKWEAVCRDGRVSVTVEEGGV